ncbi:hypothetical protein AQF52_5446 [Streptomyces venezuelae]|uniref:hypothetical protein n=1 Tax=Streptomyces gardneri TaxID=66892 RepID=UPI0006BC3CB5|nr:hypothetical protein [Streptomyces gardneri]ALO11040.1 hypothetical protein AQF52_5446 [Streptomyces venezuelae]QPK47981.1 hypothetical protein H4W23_27330 [Streptomyces gardneri]WRK39437.1 hypothetical protein U0M97_27455 [Streptomyces venezuelae]CUM38456.1 hypothetical protein BN2537_5877 [Streptomyces venezuelae]
MTGLGAEPSDLLHHLLMDRAIKVVIVAVALGILALGMTVIRRRTGRAKNRLD